jgi:hypothetical protein
VCVAGFETVDHYSLVRLAGVLSMTCYSKSFYSTDSYFFTNCFYLEPAAILKVTGTLISIMKIRNKDEYVLAKRGLSTMPRLLVEKHLTERHLELSCQ